MADKENMIFKFLEKLFSHLKDELESKEVDDETDKEYMTFVKGEYTTKITVIFDTNGDCLGTITQSVKHNSEDSLTLDQRITLLIQKKNQAIDREDFTLAAQLRDEIKELMKRK